MSEVKVTIENLIARLETHDAENCVSIKQHPRTEDWCIEVWDETSGKTIDYINLPNS